MWCRRVLPATLPAPLSATLSPALWVYLCKCGAVGSASAWTACAICPTLRQSQSRHSHASPLHPGARLRPSYQSGCVYFLFPWCQSPLLFDSLSVLVVRGGAVCLPTPPSWCLSLVSRNFYRCVWVDTRARVHTSVSWLCWLRGLRSSEWHALSNKYPGPTKILVFNTILQ